MKEFSAVEYINYKGYYSWSGRDTEWLTYVEERWNDHLHSFIFSRDLADKLYDLVTDECPEQLDLFLLSRTMWMLCKQYKTEVDQLRDAWEEEGQKEHLAQLFDDTREPR